MARKKEKSLVSYSLAFTFHIHQVIKASREPFDLRRCIFKILLFGNTVYCSTDNFIQVVFNKPIVIHLYIRFTIYLWAD